MKTNMDINIKEANRIEVARYWESFKMGGWQVQPDI